MVNEAFMFFWLVSLVEALVVICVLGSFVTLVACLFYATYADEIEDATGASLPSAAKRLGAATVLLWLVAALIPPTESFYAGAGQYVAESAELDETLLQLKDVIDQKIAELAEETD
jgi:hypothetical protein